VKQSFKHPFLCCLFLLLVASACKKTPQASTTPKKDTEVITRLPGIKKDSIDRKRVQDSLALLKFRKKDTISIVGVGDIMLGTTFPAGQNFLAPEDGKLLLKPAEEILKSADIAFGNHEGTLFDGKGTPKSCSDPTKCYAFKSPERYVSHLAAAGFDLMSIANNHSGDFGPEARATTAKVLKKAGIEVAGSLEIPYTIIIKDSIKYGLAAFSPNTGTCRIEEIAEAKKTVAHLDSLCDIVIVSFHGGAEGKAHQHITKKTEIFYGEDRGNVYAFSHAMVDAGADVIFGHGPHVVRAVELYKGKFIAYSLGNFCTYARFNLKSENSYAPIVKVILDNKGKFLKGEIISMIQLGEGGPVMDENKCAAKKIKELTMTDFPGTKLSISDDGIITVK
jgi:poly-gamma-glutamate capsule biosynthesis protein CapA/YwtB (metallophosphatase superfamily)